MEPVFESVGTYSPEEFVRWVEKRESLGDVNRYELLHGRIVRNPPAGWPHGDVEGGIVTAFRNFVHARRLGRVFGSSQGYLFPSGDIVEPDCAFVSNARLGAMTPEVGEFLRVVPDLLVEILSPSTASRDRGEKRGIYERNGVLEYWLVDPRARRITVLALEDGRFVEHLVVEGDGEARSKLLDGLSVPLADVFP